MRRQMILSLCLTAFLLLAGSASMRAQGTCSASCILGLCHCDAVCGPGEIAKCKSGVFSASCECIPFHVFPRYHVTSSQYSSAESLSQYLQDAGGSEGGRLANLLDEVIRTSREPSDRDYSAAENAFADAYENASEETRDLIAAWLEENGY